MPDQFLTLKDLAAREGTDDLVGLIEHVKIVAPEIDVVPGRVISGIHYLARVRTAIHASRAFRKVNAGVALGASSYDQKRFNCYFFDAQMQIDEAEAIAAETQGDSMGKLMTEEAGGAMRAKAIYLGAQFYTGTTNDAEGPPGLVDFLVTQGTVLDSRTGKAIDQVVTASGTAGSSITLEDCWFAHVGPQGVHFLFGGGRGLVQNPWERQYVKDSNGKRFLAYLSNVSGYIGTSMADFHAVGVIKDIDTYTYAAGAFTYGLNDKLIAALWAKFPISLKPNVAFASQKVIATLQNSRSVTLFGNLDEGTGPGGKRGDVAVVAPWPTNLPTAGGIPIIPTDSIAARSAVASLY